MEKTEKEINKLLPQINPRLVSNLNGKKNFIISLNKRRIAMMLVRNLETHYLMIIII